VELTRSMIALAALLLLSGAASAAVAVGDEAPAVKADEILDPSIKSLKDLEGRLILYEFFAHW